MNKFKVGDKVRCVAKGGNAWISVGDEYTVEMIEKNFIYIQAKKTPPGFSRLTSYDSNLFEYADDLDTLIEQANALFPKLHARRDEIEIRLSVGCDWAAVVTYFDEVKLRRRKAPALPAPFTLKDSKYSVQIGDAKTVKVGCQTYPIKPLTEALVALVQNNYSIFNSISGIEFFATKQGVFDGQHRITWADAEQLLTALEKVKA